MPYSHILKSSLCAIVLLALFPISAQALEVSFYAGDAKILRKSKMVTITIGAKLQTGDIIKTGNNGLVEIIYKDKSKIIIREKSTVKIGSTSIKGSDNAALLIGKITAKFSKLKKQRKVYTPTTVAAIRGTEFNVAVSKGGNSRVDLKEGKLKINNPYGQVNIKGGDKTEANVGSGPDKTDEGKLDEWSRKQDSDFEKDPKQNSQAYKKYISTFKQRAESSKSEIKDNNSAVQKAKTKEDLVQAGDKISTSEEKIEDDLILNDTANGAIQIIIDNFKNRKNTIYRDFERLKRESNKVMEVQKKSYQDIQAVKDAHKKAYEEIMGKFKSDRDSIKGDIDFDSVKPKFKKKKND